MASNRVGEYAAAALSDSGAPHHNQIPFGVPHMLHHSNTSFINLEVSDFDFGELEEAIVLQGVKFNNNNEIKQTLYATVKPAATLEMFPSWPIRFQQKGSSKSGEESTDSGRSPLNTLSTRLETESESPVSRKASPDHQTAAAAAFDYKHHHLQPLQPPLQRIQQVQMASGSDNPGTGISQAITAAKQTPEKRRGPGSNSEKVLDAKTMRRLAQNREAARKSRIRKKAYVQQLESSRIRLTQLEQDLQRARSQGLFLGGGVANGNISSGGAVFDMEYARWVDDDHGHMTELRNALQSHLSDGDLRVIVDGYITHYDEIFRLRGVAAKSDVFHLITGMWATTIERCFLWMGGFRPSDLIKMLISQLDPLTEQQLVGIYGLQQSTQQAEEALSQGLEQLHQSLLDAIANASLNDSMHHMVVALGKITNLEGFVRQADNLRQQTLHQLRRVLTVRQAAKCFLVIGEYYGRLRTLSSLWASRPRETLISDSNGEMPPNVQMIQHSQINQFSNF
ncbi:transcription factor TGA9-like isoform X1 [Primulina eburnea]|uniref:transcription factor TGA9-like isoform X1 n=2 Tax=Primulina eburnea TaxID=1245227 RepID=UPI003C6C1D3B